MQSIKEILAGPKVSNWSGSTKTRDMVAEQIEKIWGKNELANYSAEKSALPFSVWLNLGYRPKRGSKSLKSITYIERKDSQGNVIRKYPRKINLFYYLSVEPISS